jgi:hypothetical protein
MPSQLSSLARNGSIGLSMPFRLGLFEHSYEAAPEDPPRPASFARSSNKARHLRYRRQANRWPVESNQRYGL